jgi:hypothetical protein
MQTFSLMQILPRASHPDRTCELLITGAFSVKG